MVANLAWISGSVAGLRVYAKGSYEERSSYCWCVTVIKHGSAAELQLALRGPRAEECKAMQDCLRRAGFMCYWRYNKRNRMVVVVL